MGRFPFVTVGLLFLSFLVTREIQLDPSNLQKFSMIMNPSHRSDVLGFGTLACVFAHVNWEHYLNNAFGWIIGGLAVEYEVGWRIYVRLLAASQFGCLILSFVAYFFQDALLLGSSGALFGVFAFYFIYAHKRGFESAWQRIGAFSMGVGLFQQIVLATVNAFPDSAVRIAVSGHLGGVAGAVLFWRYYYVKQDPDPPSMEDVMAEAFSRLRR